MRELGREDANSDGTSDFEGGKSDAPTEEGGFRINPEVFADRISELARRAGGFSSLSRQTGISRRMLRNYLSGSQIGLENALALAVQGGVSLDWLAGRTASESGGADVLYRGGAQRVLIQAKTYRDPEQPGGVGGQHETYALLRYLPADADAGLRLPGGATEEPPVIFSDDYLRRTFNLSPRDVVVVQAAGDSMEPTIADGDVLLVDIRQPQLRSDGIYVVRLGDMLQPKRLELQLDRSITVKSDNERYAPKQVPPRGAEGFEVVGRVIWRGRPF